MLTQLGGARFCHRVVYAAATQLAAGSLRTLLPRYESIYSAMRSLCLSSVTRSTELKHCEQKL